MAEQTTTKRMRKTAAKAAEPEAVQAEEKKTYSEDDVKKMIAEAVAKAMADMPQPVPAVLTAAPQDETVTIMFLAEVSRENVLELPGYGILRPNSYLEIPKKEFGGKFMSQLARQLIEKRHVLVLNGLTEDERRRWNCDYKPGETLDEYLFDHLLDLPTEQLCGIFERLCPEHRLFVVRRFITAEEAGDNRVDLDKVKRLNECAVACGAIDYEKRGLFSAVLDRIKEKIQ